MCFGVGVVRSSNFSRIVDLSALTRNNVKAFFVPPWHRWDVGRNWIRTTSSLLDTLSYPALWLFPKQQYSSCRETICICLPKEHMSVGGWKLSLRVVKENVGKSQRKKQLLQTISSLTLFYFFPVHFPPSDPFLSPFFSALVADAKGKNIPLFPPSDHIVLYFRCLQFQIDHSPSYT